MLVKVAYLHTPVTLDGKTETTISPEKLPQVKMEWVPGPFLKLESGKTSIVVPATNVRYTLLADSEKAEVRRVKTSA